MRCSRRRHCSVACYELHAPRLAPTDKNQDVPRRVDKASAFRVDEGEYFVGLNSRDGDGAPGCPLGSSLGSPRGVTDSVPRRTGSGEAVVAGRGGAGRGGGHIGRSLPRQVLELSMDLVRNVDSETPAAVLMWKCQLYSIIPFSYRPRIIFELPDSEYS